MKDQNCAYCMQGELVAKFGYPVCAMDTGYVYIFKEQSKPGRVILAYKDHVSEMIDISDEERDAFLPMWQRWPGLSTSCSILTR